MNAELEVLEQDTLRMRKDKPFVFTNLKEETGLQRIIEFIVEQGMLQPAAG